MATTEIAALVLGFRFIQFPALSSLTNRNQCSTLSCDSLPSIRKSSCFRIYSSSSLTNEVVKFTEDENRLVEALIGIEGRGSSASPQQLKVLSFFKIKLFYFIVGGKFFIW